MRLGSFLKYASTLLGANSLPTTTHLPQITLGALAGLAMATEAKEVRAKSESCFSHFTDLVTPYLFAYIQVGQSQDSSLEPSL